MRSALIAKWGLFPWGLFPQPVKKCTPFCSFAQNWSASGFGFEYYALLPNKTYVLLCMLWNNQVKRTKTWLQRLNKLKTVTRKHVIIRKTVSKTFIEYTPLSRELVPMYMEQVIGGPLRTEPSFTALNVGLESPRSSTFCAAHNTKASLNNCHSKDVRHTDLRRTKYRREKLKRLKTKALKTKTNWSQLFGLQTLPRRTIFWGCQMLPMENFFLQRFQTSPLLTARGFRRHLKKSCSPVRSIQKSVIFYKSKNIIKTKPEICLFFMKIYCFLDKIFLTYAFEII